MPMSKKIVDHHVAIMSGSKNANCWTPDESQENRKLSNDRGCRLASGTVTSRTRGGRLAARITDVGGVANANDNDNANPVGEHSGAATPHDQPTELLTCPSGTTASTLTADTAATPPRGKTASLMHTRGTFEVQAIRSLELHLACPNCRSSIEVETPTAGIASGLRLKCRNDFCTFLHSKRPQATDFDLPASAGSPLVTRTTDFSVNILFVLSMLCSGDGPTEAGRVLGPCGLPNSTTMQTCNFTNVEGRMSPMIHQLADECLRANLEKEVQLAFEDETNDEGVLMFDLWKEGKLPNNLLPKVDFTADVSW